MNVMTDWRASDWRALFEQMHPGFFEMPNIRRLPEKSPFEEMALDLHTFSGDASAVPAPKGVSFSLYAGGLDALRADIARVDEGWPELFDGSRRIYCAFAGDRVASFCLLEDMAVFRGLRVGGPGCVGTLPEYRRRGIGLEMVRRATALLKADGFDVSYIHFTGVAPWYARLGYRTVLRWTRDGWIG